MAVLENADIRTFGELLDALEQLDKRIRSVADEARRLSRIVNSLREDDGFFARYMLQFANEVKAAKEANSPAQADADGQDEQSLAARAAQ